MPGEEPFKHSLGVINLLTMTNYATWKEDCIQILLGIMAWDIVMEVEAEPDEPEDQDSFAKEAVLERKAYKNYLQRKSQATAIIYGSCSSSVKVYVKGMRDPVKMWKELEVRANGANSSVGRMTLFRKFIALRPIPGQTLDNYFSQLLEISTQLTGSEEAVSDMMFKNHIFTTLPPAYGVTIEILQSRAQVTLQEVLDTLKECELNRAMTTKPDAVSDALYTQQAGRGGRGGGRGGYRGGQGREQKPWCTWCKTGTHTTDNCWSKDKKNNKRTREDQGLTTVGCYYCGEEGHIRIDCPVRKKGNALRNSVKNTEHTEGNGPTGLKPEDNPQ
jgi:hypothetical protein